MQWKKEPMGVSNKILQYLTVRCDLNDLNHVIEGQKRTVAHDGVYSTVA